MLTIKKQIKSFGALIAANRIASSKAKPSNGFTLIELMLSISVLAVLISLAAPSVGIFLQNQRVTAQAETISSAMSVARASALSEAAQTKVCWNPGETNRVVNTVTITPGHMAVYFRNPARVLRDFNYSEGSFVDDNDGNNCIRFDEQGRLISSTVNGGVALVFGICRSDGDTEGSRAVVISQTGRATNVENTTQSDCS